MHYQISIYNNESGNRIIFDGASPEELAKKIWDWDTSKGNEKFRDYDETFMFAKKNAYKSFGNSKQELEQNTDRLTFPKMINAARAAFYIGTGMIADKKTVNSRAAICLRCKLFKVGSSGCKSCGASRNLARVASFVSSFFGKGINTPQQVRDSHCGFCNCSLDMLLHMHDIKLKGESPEQNAKRPDRCWLKINK
jgi:hypothetical protein